MIPHSNAPRAQVVVHASSATAIASRVGVELAVGSRALSASITIWLATSPWLMTAQAVRDGPQPIAVVEQEDVLILLAHRARRRSHRRSRWRSARISVRGSAAAPGCSCRPPSRFPAKCHRAARLKESGRGNERTKSTLGRTCSEPAVHHIVMGRRADCATLTSGAPSATLTSSIGADGPVPVRRIAGKGPRRRASWSMLESSSALATRRRIECARPSPSFCNASAHSRSTSSNQLRRGARELDRRHAGWQLDHDGQGKVAADAIDARQQTPA